MGIWEWGRKKSCAIERERDIEIQNQIQLQVQSKSEELDKHSEKASAAAARRQSENIADAKVEHVGCQMTAESLRATKEILRLCNMAQDSGAHTLRMLHSQGDQLNNTERHLDGIHGNLQTTGGTLGEIERSERRCCWCCAACITGGVVGPDESSNRNQKSWRKTNTNVPITNQPNSIHQNSKCAGNPEEQLVGNLGQISFGLSQLKYNASNINSVAQTQTKQIEKLQNKTVNNTVEINDQTNRTNVLLKK